MEVTAVSRTSDGAHGDHDHQDEVPRTTGSAITRGSLNWFGALFGIVVLLGVSVLSILSRPGPVGDVAATVEQPVADTGIVEAPEADDHLDEAAHEMSPVDPVPTSAVLLGLLAVDSFGFHGLEAAYADATEVDSHDADAVANVLAAVDAVEWPDGVVDVAGAFRAEVAALHAAMAAHDVDAARHGLEAVHASQHILSNAVYAWLAGTYGWLAGTPIGGHDDHMAAQAPDAQAPEAEAPDGIEVIEVEMVEFGYIPEVIDIKAGVPVILRFTNTGRLVHEAMVGDAHMQEEFAAAGDHDDGHGGGDDHHGDLMAVTVAPGETVDLEVVIDRPGTWYVACHLIGHYEKGQVGTINVMS
jgi:uncharacterized cupredoxin-like copper-binding protein